MEPLQMKKLSEDNYCNENIKAIQNGVRIVLVLETQ